MRITHKLLQLYGEGVDLGLDIKLNLWTKDGEEFFSFSRLNIQLLSIPYFRSLKANFRSILELFQCVPLNMRNNWQPLHRQLNLNLCVIVYINTRKHYRDKTNLIKEKLSINNFSVLTCKHSIWKFVAGIKALLIKSRLHWIDKSANHFSIFSWTK